MRVLHALIGLSLFFVTLVYALKLVVQYTECTNSVTAAYNDLIAYYTPHPKYLRPILNCTELFPESLHLERNAASINDEIQAFMTKYHTLTANESSPTTFGQKFAEDGWRLVLLKFYNKEYPHIQKHFPKTMRVLKECKSKVKLAMFSILKAHSQIKPHTGPFRGSMRYHLGLQVPKNRQNCFIQVENYQYHWSEGESFLFDDTFVHQVVNDTDEDRIVLFLDIQRTGSDVLSPFMDWINTCVCNSFIIHSLSALNEKNERPLSLKREAV